MAALVVMLLLPCVASCMSWTPTSRARWRSMDCVSRRLQFIIDESDGDVKLCAQWALFHVLPIRDQHGGEFEEDRQIELGSEDELTLIAAQHGRSGDAAHLRDLMSSVGYHTGGAFWRALKRLWWTYLPWAIIVGILYCLVLRRGSESSGKDRALNAMFRRVEELIADSDRRASEFNDPDINREYQKQKAKGLVTPSRQAPPDTAQPPRTAN